MSLNDVNASPCDIRLEPHARYPESTEKKKTEKYLVSKRQQNMKKCLKVTQSFLILPRYLNIVKDTETYWKLPIATLSYLKLSKLPEPA